MLLDKKTVLITGASKGIGEEIARCFAEEGARVVLLSRNELQLIEVVQRLPVVFLPHEYYKCDVTDVGDINSVVKDCKLKGIEFDAIVNNAGVMKSSMLIFSSDSDIKENIEINLVGTIKITQAFVKGMLKNKRGSIINITSIIGTNGSAGQSVYSASKGGVISFTKSLSKELAPLNIRVNAIAPGFIETDLVASLTENVKAETIKSIGMKRAGKARDVAKVALFFASELSDYVTGQIIGVDGGMTI